MMCWRCLRRAMRARRRRGGRTRRRTYPQCRICLGSPRATHLTGVAFIVLSPWCPRSSRRVIRLQHWNVSLRADLLTVWTPLRSLATGQCVDYSKGNDPLETTADCVPHSASQAYTLDKEGHISAAGPGSHCLDVYCKQRRSAEATPTVSPRPVAVSVQWPRRGERRLQDARCGRLEPGLDAATRQPPADGIEPLPRETTDVPHPHSG